MTDQQVMKESGTSMSVLLVEDNPINQQLAVAMLTEWKHRVEVAVDGEQALQMHKNGKYDLILMDLQMPVMDGTEATKKIREREVNSPYCVTIIAMTANSPSNNKEKCLSAGMDDYFAKPFTVEQFHALIKKHAKLRDNVTRNEANGGVATFNYAAALRQADPIIVSMIAKPFLDDLPEQLLTMRRSWEKHDLEVFQRGAHNLSGLLGSFHAEPARHIAAEIERNVRSHQLENLFSLFQKLENEIDLFSLHLRSYEIS
jgi:protein-histidine pros-kinase